MKPTYVLLALAASGCTDTTDAVRVMLPVGTTAAAPAAATTDLGYDVTVTSIAIGVTGIQFTIEGEMHEDVTAPPGTVLHPGHSAGGEVTGELQGNHVLRWTGGAQPAIGTGTLIVGSYQGANFTFRPTDSNDDLPANDPLFGHALHVTGTATKDGMTRPFDAVLDVERDTTVIGAPFVADISETSTPTLAFTFNPVDPEENDTAFDGIDFFTLAATGPIEIRPGSAAHNILRRVITTHDHYAVFPE